MSTAISSRDRLGLPLAVLIGLALLASIRALLHDTHIVETGNPVTLLLAFAPLAIWVAVAVLWSRRPLVSLLVVGVIHGILLGTMHVLLWEVNLAGSGLEQPALGGNLHGALPPLLEAILLRGAAFVSSAAVGVVMGAVAGLIAWGIRRIPAAKGLPRSVSRLR